MEKREYPLTLDSDGFNALKSDFNQILRSTLSNMIQKEGEKAEVKISVKITLTEGYEAERQIIIPKFEHKVSSVMQYKDEKSGITGGANYELVWDKDEMAYVMRPIEDAQLSIFDGADDDESNLDVEHAIIEFYEDEGSEDDAGSEGL